MLSRSAHVYLIRWPEELIKVSSTWREQEGVGVEGCQVGADEVRVGLGLWIRVRIRGRECLFSQYWT